MTSGNKSGAGGIRPQTVQETIVKFMAEKGFLAEQTVKTQPLISILQLLENEATTAEDKYKFYKKFGFIENEGNPLFDDMSMYRLPQKF